MSTGGPAGVRLGAGPRGRTGEGLANGRLDAENEIVEVRLTRYARMVAIVETQCPVRVGSLQPTLWGIHRVTRGVALAEPYPCLSASLVQVAALIVAGKYPIRIANV